MEQVFSGVSVDGTFDALGDVQRRRVLLSLLDSTAQDKTTVVGGGAEHEGDTLDSLVMLKHVHFPKLASYGFIEWDKGTDEVGKGPLFDEIRPLLKLLDNHQDELPAEWI